MRKSIYSHDQEMFQALLKELRVNAGLRQVDLADKLGCHQSFVSKYEAGERRLDILELRTVCRALGVGMNEVVKQLEERLDEA
jgi:transcriptional regulator with XRE-family HTH domain